MSHKTLALAIILPAVMAGAARGADIQILVAEKENPAAANADKLANGTTVFAEKKLHKALDKAAELLTGDNVVTIKLAAGQYEGKGGAAWSFPEVAAPKATLRILGGYDEQFQKRAPFSTPTYLLSGATALTFDGRKPAIGELYISGLVFDVYKTNSYDGPTNCLLKGSSQENPILSVRYVETNRLVIADNVFLNSAHFASAPLPRAASKDAVVIVRNNFIMNNVHAWLVDSARYRNIPKTYTVEGNSFILNWPYNPDPTTSNPAALEIAGKYAAGKVVIKDNLFAHNMGGAIYATFADDIGPPMEIKHNLFFNNGLLFGLKEDKAGAVVGKFGAMVSRDVPWGVFDIATVEEEYDWDTKDNVVLDPKVAVTMVKPGFANSSSVEAEKSTLNDVRSILGMSQKGGKVQISNFAPRMAIDFTNLPFPQEEAAKAFGVRPDRVEQF
jgi:hypothetical protein